MFFLAALTSLFAASSALAAPIAEDGVAKRAGPSGYVVYPPGGTQFENQGGAAPNPAGGIGYVHIQYQGVTWASSNAATVGVDVYLEDPTGAKADQYLTYNFAGSNPGGLIDGYFSPPSGACGDFNLVFIEHQNMGNYGDIIDFRAAAPAISILCDPIQ